MVRKNQGRPSFNIGQGKVDIDDEDCNIKYLKAYTAYLCIFFTFVNQSIYRYFYAELFIFLFQFLTKINFL